MVHRALGLAAITLMCACVAAPRPESNAQGWSPKQQQDWYAATQGSRLIPLSWLKALEQPDRAEPFLSPEYLRGFGLLVDDNRALPVGFAIDEGPDTALNVTKLQWFKGQGPKEHWAGLNCSACHTAELEYDGRKVRVDGGPSLFDFQSFIEALDAALQATRTDEQKFGRFAKAVLAKPNDATDRQMLEAALDRLIQWEGQVEALNRTPLRYGHGRVDAFGHIFNKIALFSGGDRSTPNPADAPVSYPFLWDIYRHDKLQWNGIATNQRFGLGGGRYLDYGALGRNTGEVIGVFGDITVTPSASLRGYPSSIQADNLIRLETQLSALRAPPWPATIFGAADPDKVTAGRQLFEAHCKSCHQGQPGTAPQKVVMMPLKDGNLNSTDPWMACNAISYRSATGNLKGKPKGFLGGGARYDADAPLAEMLETVVKGALVGKKGPIIREGVSVFFGRGRPPRVVIEEVPDLRQARLDACYAAGSDYMAYKARPLDGIWATAPFLHNGSVPTLYDLLRPAAQRPTEFAVGTRQYDPARVGYVVRPDAPGNVFRFKTRDAGGNPIPGNSNEGHDYGASQLSEPDRLALIEYLKTL